MTSDAFRAIHCGVEPSERSVRYTCYKIRSADKELDLGDEVWTPQRFDGSSISVELFTRLQENPDMDSEKISKQLETIISLLKLTNRDALAAVRDTLDDVSKALIEATTEPVVVGKLKRDVAKATSQSEKTVQRRIAELVAMGALARDGGGSSATYRSTGLL